MILSPALIITIAIQVGCQIFKFLYYSILHRKIEIKRLFSTGGMPSAHTAFVSALTVSVGLTNGLDSMEFCISAVLSTIVVFDALRLRSTVDGHSQLLKKLVKLLPKHEADFQPAKVGHNRKEVLVGLVVGIGLSATAYFLFVS